MIRNLRFAVCLGLGTAAYFMSAPGIVRAAENDCASENCGEEPEAPYVLRIINSGESQPRSTNTTPEGQSDNRRVDVSVTRRVPVENTESEKQSAEFGSNGRVWLSQDPASLERILAVDAPASASVFDGKPVTDVSFEIDTNYAAYIDKLELLVWLDGGSETSEPLMVHSLDSAVGSQKWNWNLNLPNTPLKPGQRFQYALRASDKDGHIDQTTRRILYIVSPENDETFIRTRPKSWKRSPN